MPTRTSGKLANNAKASRSPPERLRFECFRNRKGSRCEPAAIFCRRRAL